MSDVISRARKVQFDRHAGMGPPGIACGPVPNLAEWCAARTRRERQILGLLLAAQEHHGMVVLLSRADLRASDQTMHDMYYAGMVNGCGGPDRRGTGNTAESSFWWLTERGEQVARACGLPPKVEA
ncbi:hypothetical protein [Roseococcus thiosulfatophilus]|uniref:hypothetical protein n=1 Tax=Roseococcus thiosulfatophilus TaxID=35813 RepID=UPI001A8C3419|nr:hypothetical protein [Roseococcus thiosulfatophilus]